MIQPSWNVTSLVAARAPRATAMTPPPEANPASSAAEPLSMRRRVRSWRLGVRLIVPPLVSNCSATLAGFPGESKPARLRCHGELDREPRRELRRPARRHRDARRQPDLGPGQSLPRIRGHARPRAARPFPAAHALRSRAPGRALPRPERPRVPAHSDVRAGGRRRSRAACERVEDVLDPLEGRRARAARRRHQRQLRLAADRGGRGRRAARRFQISPDPRPGVERGAEPLARRQRLRIARDVPDARSLRPPDRDARHHRRLREPGTGARVRDAPGLLPRRCQLGHGPRARRPDDQPEPALHGNLAGRGRGDRARVPRRGDRAGHVPVPRAPALAPHGVRAGAQPARREVNSTPRRQTLKTVAPALKQIASGLRFPEGPVAMSDGSVVLVEIERRTLSRVTPDGKVHVVAALGGGPNGAAMGPGGKIYVTNNGGLKFVDRPGKLFPIAQANDYKGGSIQIVDPETGKFETLYDACDGVKLRGPNDLVFDSAGGFWFTDLGKTRDRDMDRGVVFYAKADGSMIREAIFPLERPNGIGLSPDERTLYVVETPTARCCAFKLGAPGQIESANGPYRGEKGTVLAGLPGYQMFDSLAVDGEGHVCVATLITGAVSDIWPDGSRVDQYKLPDMMVTNVCFGGRDLRTAFATLSMGGTLVSFEWPRAGLALRHLNK